MDDQSSGTTPSLRRNAVGLGGAVIMSAALMGPAVSVYFNPQVTAANAGIATPFVFVLGLLVMILVANGVMEMARVLPSAGAFYTYVSRGIGPRAGFLTGALMFAAYALLVPAELALIGVYSSDILGGYGVHIHWTVIAAGFTALMVFLSLRGITSSLHVALGLFAAEVAVILLLSVVVLAKGGAEGLSIAPLNPAESANGLSGIALGMVFALLSFVGFEAAATLGEEVRDPQRNVPRGMLLALLLVGGIYLFCTYAEMVGFGRAGVDDLVGDTAPFTTLATTYAPWLKLLVGLAGVSSIFAVTMNTNNGIVRILFAMSREGMLPAPLATVHPQHRTPTTAIWATAAFAVLLTFGVGLVSGPFNTYVYLGLILTLAIIPVYMLTNAACIRYFAAREDRSVLRHLVLPVLGILLLLIPVDGLLIPVPPAPLRYFPYLVLAYIVAAWVYATVLARTRPEALRRAGAVLATGDAAVDEAPARTGTTA